MRLPYSFAFIVALLLVALCAFASYAPPLRPQAPGLVINLPQGALVGLAAAEQQPVFALEVSGVAPVQARLYYRTSPDELQRFASGKQQPPVALAGSVALAKLRRPALNQSLSFADFGVKPKAGLWWLVVEQNGQQVAHAVVVSSLHILAEQDNKNIYLSVFDTRRHVPVPATFNVHDEDGKNIARFMADALGQAQWPLAALPNTAQLEIVAQFGTQLAKLPLPNWRMVQQQVQAPLPAPLLLLAPEHVAFATPRYALQIVAPHLAQQTVTILLSRPDGMVWQKQSLALDAQGYAKASLQLSLPLPEGAWLIQVQNTQRELLQERRFVPQAPQKDYALALAIEPQDEQLKLSLAATVADSSNAALRNLTGVWRWRWQSVPPAFAMPQEQFGQDVALAQAQWQEQAFITNAAGITDLALPNAKFPQAFPASARLELVAELKDAGVILAQAQTSYDTKASTQWLGVQTLADDVNGTQLSIRWLDAKGQGRAGQLQWHIKTENEDFSWRYEQQRWQWQAKKSLQTLAAGELALRVAEPAILPLRLPHGRYQLELRVGNMAREYSIEIGHQPEQQAQDGPRLTLSAERMDGQLKISARLPATSSGTLSVYGQQLLWRGQMSDGLASDRGGDIFVPLPEAALPQQLLIVLQALDADGRLQQNAFELPALSQAGAHASYGFILPAKVPARLPPQNLPIAIWQESGATAPKQLLAPSQNLHDVLLAAPALTAPVSGEGIPVGPVAGWHLSWQDERAMLMPASLPAPDFSERVLAQRFGDAPRQAVADIWPPHEQILANNLASTAVTSLPAARLVLLSPQQPYNNVLASLFASPMPVTTAARASYGRWWLSLWPKAQPIPAPFAQIWQDELRNLAARQNQQGGFGVLQAGTADFAATAAMLLLWQAAMQQGLLAEPPPAMLNAQLWLSRSLEDAAVSPQELQQRSLWLPDLAQLQFLSPALIQGFVARVKDSAPPPIVRLALAVTLQAIGDGAAAQALEPAMAELLQDKDNAALLLLWRAAQLDEAQQKQLWDLLAPAKDEASLVAQARLLARLMAEGPQSAVQKLSMGADIFELAAPRLWFSHAMQTLRNDSEQPIDWFLAEAAAENTQASPLWQRQLFSAEDYPLDQSILAAEQMMAIELSGTAPEGQSCTLMDDLPLGLLPLSVAFAKPDQAASIEAHRLLAVLPNGGAFKFRYWVRAKAPGRYVWPSAVLRCKDLHVLPKRNLSIAAD